MASNDLEVAETGGNLAYKQLQIIALALTKES